MFQTQKQQYHLIMIRYWISSQGHEGKTWRRLKVFSVPLQCLFNAGSESRFLFALFSLRYSTRSDCKSLIEYTDNQVIADLLLLLPQLHLFLISVREELETKSSGGHKTIISENQEKDKVKQVLHPRDHLWGGHLSVCFISRQSLLQKEVTTNQREYNNHSFHHTFQQQTCHQESQSTSQLVQQKFLQKF